MRWVALVGTLAVIGSLGLAGCDGDDHKNQAPVARISASPQSGPTPLVVTLDASASTDKEDRIEGYDWATGDGTTSAGVTVTHTYERPGEFTVTLRVTDHKGKTSTASQVVTVENRPPVAAFTATPESGAAPLVVVFDASASNDPDGSIEQYAWEFPAGTASGEIVQHRFEEPGEFEVTLRVVDDVGASATALSTIRVEELPAYQMTSLGTLDGLPSEGLDINERGEVAGQLTVPCSGPCGSDIYSRVFLYRDREMIDIGTLGGAGTRFGDLNNLGQITGASQNAAGVEHAFLYADGEMIELPPFDQPIPDDPPDTLWLPPSEGVAINDRGEVVGNLRVLQRIGSSGDFGSCRGASRWDANGTTDLAWGCNFTFPDRRPLNSNARFVNATGSILLEYEANPQGDDIVIRSALLRGGETTGLGFRMVGGLNDWDSVVGRIDDGYNYTWGAFLYRDGELVELPEIGGSAFYPSALNSLDQVVGFANASDGYARAFLYTDGAMVDLGTLGGPEVNPGDMNDAGEVTGSAQIDGGDWHAFVYSDGRMIDLGTLGGPYSAGKTINNLGQVTGSSTDADGAVRAFLATPIRLLLTRLEEEVDAASVDAVLLQRAEAAKEAYAARDGRQSCSALAAFRARVKEIGEAALGAGQATMWLTKSQEISDALHCP